MLRLCAAVKVTSLTRATGERADLRVLRRILLGVTEAKVHVMVCKYRRLEGQQHITLHPPAAVIVTGRRRRDQPSETAILQLRGDLMWVHCFDGHSEQEHRSSIHTGSNTATKRGFMRLLASNITRPVDSSRRGAHQGFGVPPEHISYIGCHTGVVDDSRLEGWRLLLLLFALHLLSLCVV